MTNWAQILIGIDITGPYHKGTRHEVVGKFMGNAIIFLLVPFCRDISKLSLSRYAKRHKCSIWQSAKIKYYFLCSYQKYAIKIETSFLLLPFHIVAGNLILSPHVKRQKCRKRPSCWQLMITIFIKLVQIATIFLLMPFRTCLENVILRFYTKWHKCPTMSLT